MVIVMIIMLLVLLAAAAYLVMILYPAFGQRAGKLEKSVNSRSLQYSHGKFAYPETAVISSGSGSEQAGGGGGISILKDFIKGNPRSRPAEPLEPLPVERSAIGQASGTRVTWFGHSAVLLEMDGAKIFLDPMLGNAPSPFPFIGGRRYSIELPITAAGLPEIDAVVLSHDHYDHLDYGTIRKLKDKTGLFIVPLGVGAHLRRWGVSKDRIRECDWGDELTYAGITFTSAPARHFSGRSLLDRNATLWCSWVIKGKQSKVFFSGDSGYGRHFAEIGRKYGPFDLTLMECGQYDPRWADIHMLPEQTVAAHLDVRGELLIPIHWGAFTLSMHDWTDPVERVSAAAAARGVRLATPRIGEPVAAGSAQFPVLSWWR
ncbi:MBL fold metallo-hydrolase [Paenibacillus sp. MMS20-IR301]|uniref:MBL fold metallo-hydrolase n=1 Tax=Paenibacillus sp. MMS20-IR301 TaxID=2895946 RepID=UPI0028E980F7|nr:MBL fold metallo-hydrolase [Paenibacillus sp. MMS20-IR301]WNS42459.1 MBL fold metallo-hydrolase [Paenibacillus sp. MMS20-IR301]